MTVQTQNTANSSVADGVEVNFNFTFQTLDASWVRARNAPPGGEFVERPDITVTLNPDQEAAPGGVVTFDTAPLDGWTVEIYRNTPRTQLTDYTDYDAFPAESHEDALDKLTMISQETEGGTGGSGGDFLPLAGGTMDVGAEVVWQSSGGISGDQGYGLLLGQPSFLWAPSSNLQEIGFSWGAADGKILSYNGDGRFSLALVGRVSTFENLLDEDFITKADTSDMRVISFTWEHDTDPTSFGSISSSYQSATLGGTAGGQALRFATAADSIYQGYKFVTENVDGSQNECDIAGGQFYSDRQQDNGANAPLLDSMVSRRWVENFGPGGVPEAPVDGNEYVRQDAAWVINSGGSGVPEAPEDGNTYGRNNAAWVVVGAGGTVNWGDIGGTLSNQTDLQNALNAKADDNIVVKTTGSQNVGGIKTFTSGIVVSGQVSSIAVNCTAGGVAALGFNSGGQRIQNVANPSTSSDAATKSYVDATVPAGWQLAKAVGGWASNGAAQGTQRGCSVAKGAGTGAYVITLTQAVANLNDISFTATAFGAIVGISIVFSAVSTTTINVTTVRSDTGAPIDVGCTFTVFDRGLA